MALFARTLCGFVVALLCTPAGVSGAFLLLPAQLHLFGVPSPVVSATNLVYNLLATPAGALTFHRQGRLDRRLAVGLIAGTSPGVVLGVVLRSTWLASESAFAWVAATVLVGIGLRLGVGRDDPVRARGADDVEVVLPIWRLVVVGTIGGAIGGIYGFGGAALIVPYLVSIERLPIARVAGAGLLTTLVTSVIGLAAFAVAAHLDIGQAQPPDWSAGLAFGVGGALGAVLGARLQPRIPVRILRMGLGALAIGAGLRTVL
jgi:uncharacterized membrane protein YfcA